MKTKKILEAHAKAAAEERYGISLNKEARREIVRKIQTGDADFISRSSNNRTLWKVDHNEVTMNVVYDKARHALCTVLPKNAWEFGSQTTEVNCSVTPSTTTSANVCGCGQSPCQCSSWNDETF